MVIASSGRSRPTRAARISPRRAARTRRRPLRFSSLAASRSLSWPPRAALLSASDPMVRTWSTTTRVSSGALEKSSSRSRSLCTTGAFRAISPLGGHEAGSMGPLADVDSEHGPGARRCFHDGILLIVDRSESVRATPVLPGCGLACARQLPISRPGRRPPSVATPPGPLRGRGGTAIRRRPSGRLLGLLSL